MQRDSLKDLSRRSAVGLVLAAAGFLLAGRYLVTDALAKPSRKRTTAQRKQPAAKKLAELKPGQFEWHPERSPDGPIAIIISVPKQRIYVYRNGIQIAVSTCSTGKEGYETPTGRLHHPAEGGGALFEHL